MTVNTELPHEVEDGSTGGELWDAVRSFMPHIKDLTSADIKELIVVARTSGGDLGVLGPGTVIEKIFVLTDAVDEMSESITYAQAVEFLTGRAATASGNPPGFSEFSSLTDD